MGKFTGKRKNVKKAEKIASAKALDTVLTPLEMDSSKQIKIIQNIDINNFSDMLDSLTSGTVSTEKGNFQKKLQELVSNLNKMSGETLNNKVADILFVKELIFNLRKILNNSDISIELRKPFFSVLNKTEDDMVKVLDKITKYRKNLAITTSIANENHIANIVFGIYQKVLMYASPDDPTPGNNLRVILNNAIVGIQERMNNTQRGDIIQRKEADGSVVIQLPNPTKFFKREGDPEIDSITTIQELYQVLAQLKIVISGMPNIKREVGKSLKRGVKVDKYPAAVWKKMIDDLLAIVLKASKTFINILIRDTKLLLTESDKSMKMITDYYNRPIIESSNGKWTHVYNNPVNFMVVLRETYSDSMKNAYSLFIRDMYAALFVLFAELSKTDPTNGNPVFVNPIARHLELVRYSHALMDLSQLMNVQFDKEMTLITELIIELRQFDPEFEKLPVIKPWVAKKAQPAPPAGAMTVDLKQILEDMTPKKAIKKLAIEDTTGDINKFFKNIPTKTKYQKLIKKILHKMRVDWMDKLPLSFYVNYVKPEYKNLVLTHFTGFFIGNSDIYGKFPQNVVDSNTPTFVAWKVNRIDSGAFVGAHISFISKMIDLGYMDLNETTGYIEFDNNALAKHSAQIAKERESVEAAHAKVLELIKIVPVKIVNTPVAVCQHITIQKELDSEYNSLEQFPDDPIIQMQINSLESQKVACEISTGDAIRCRYCNVKMDNLMSDAPETFEKGQEMRDAQQRVDVKEVIRQEKKSKSVFTIEKYINSILGMFHVKKKQNVSAVDTNNAISNQTVDDIITFVSTTIDTSQYAIKNIAGSLNKAHTVRNVNIWALTDQVSHDIMKMLVILNIFHNIEKNLASNAGCMKQPSTQARVQCIFSQIQSLGTFVPMSVFKGPTRMNYLRNIYNEAVKIQNNKSHHRFNTDDTVITNDNLNKDRMVIIAQDFGMNSNVTRSELIKAINTEPEQTYDHDQENNERLNTIIKKYLDLFDGTMGDVTVESEIPLESMMSIYTEYNTLKDLHQRHARLPILKNHLNTLAKQLSDLEKDNSKAPLIAIRNKTEAEIITIEYKHTSKKLAAIAHIKNDHKISKTEYDESSAKLQELGFIEDPEKLNEMKRLLDSIPMKFSNSSNSMNFINMFQYLKYKSRSENLMNPSAAKYNKDHADLNITANSQDLENLFNYRKNYVASRVATLKFLNLLVKAEPYLQGKVSTSNLNGKFIIDSKVGTISFNENIIKLMAMYLKTSYNSIELFIINGLFNDKTIHAHIRTDVLPYMADFGNKLLNSYKDEVKAHTTIAKFLEKYNDIINVCPICPQTNNRNVRMKIHITSEHQINTGDHIHTVVPYQYTSKMDWIKGKSNQTGKSICPYCPHRGNNSMKVLNHIRDIHLNLSDSRALFKKNGQQHYRLHLDQLFSTYKIENGQLVTLKTKRRASENLVQAEAVAIDNARDKHDIYVNFCDKNSRDTMRHKFVDDKCIHCKKDTAAIHHDASIQGDVVNSHVKRVTKRVKQLLTRYCVTEEPRYINRPGCPKVKLSDQTQLLTVDQHWNLNRTMDHTQFTILNNVMNIVESYIAFYSPMNIMKNQTLFDIDAISEAYAADKPLTHIVTHDPEYLENMGESYRNVADGTLKKIFNSDNIVTYNKEILQLVEKINKNPEVKEITKMNRQITELKKNIRAEVVKNAEASLDKFKEESVSAFVEDLSNYTDGVNVELYTSVINSMEERTIHPENTEKVPADRRRNISETYNARTDVLKKIPGDLLKYLVLFVKGNKKGYHRAAHLLARRQ